MTDPAMDPFDEIWHRDVTTADLLRARRDLEVARRAFLREFQQRPVLDAARRAQVLRIAEARLRQLDPNSSQAKRLRRVIARLQKRRS